MTRCALRRAAALAAVAASLFITAREAAAYANGPPDGFAGQPPFERTCLTCHGIDETGDGSLSLLNIPLEYDPGQIYNLTVQLTDLPQIRWGFELTVLDDDTLQQAGTLAITDSLTTQLSDNSGTNPDYLKQTLPGTFYGVPNGPVSWNFQWTAPALGNVTFYVAGNAANGNMDNDPGDVIYSIQTPIAAPIGIEPIASPATLTRLEPSFPNPFRPATTIPFTLEESGRVRLSIYAADGRLVASLIDGDLAAGRHRLRWEGRGADGRRLASGVYFLALRARGVEARQQLVLAD